MMARFLTVVAVALLVALAAVIVAGTVELLAGVA